MEVLHCAISRPLYKRNADTCELTPVNVKKNIHLNVILSHFHNLHTAPRVMINNQPHQLYHIDTYHNVVWLWQIRYDQYNKFLSKRKVMIVFKPPKVCYIPYNNENYMIVQLSHRNIIEKIDIRHYSQL